MKNKFKSLALFTVAVFTAFTLIACPEPDDGGKNNGGKQPEFKAVTDITGLPLKKQTAADLTLNGIVTPADATNRTIVWSITDAGETGATLIENNTVLKTTAEGTVIITATIANGLTASSPFTKPFTITVQDEEVIGCGCSCGECADDCDGFCCDECTCGVPPTIIDIAQIEGVYAPEVEGIPSTTITETEQFTGTISWNGNPSKFASKTVYTATITLTAKDGFTFNGVDENFFKVLGAETTNAENSNIVTAVFPQTGGTQSEELIGKWYTTANAQESDTPYYEFTSDGRLLRQGTDTNWTYTVENDIITFTYTEGMLPLVTTCKFYIYSFSLTLYEKSGDGSQPSNGIYFKAGNHSTAIGGGDSDFSNGKLVTSFNIHNAMQWEAARAAISSGGQNKNYIVNIIGDITVSGAETYYTGNPPTKMYYTFGTTENSDGVTVSIRGTGKLTVNDNYGKDGALLTVREGQTLTLHGVTLQGHTNNNDSLVAVAGTFIMHSGKITGNTTNEPDEYGNGGGVRITRTPNAEFIMHSGEISGNTAKNGGGVFNSEYGKFTMNGGEIKDNFALNDGGGVNIDTDSSFLLKGGEISGNTASANGGGVKADTTSQFLMTDGAISGNFAMADGGGVYGNLNMSGGIIYGTDLLADITTKNTANGTGDSLNGTAAIGTYNGTFSPNANTITATDETIFIRNGSILYSDIGDAPDYLLENAWYTTQENANDREGDYLEFKADGRVFKNNAYAQMIFTVSGHTLTVKSSTSTQTVTFSYADTGTGDARQLKLTLTGGGSLLASGYFIPNPDAPIKIRTAADWNAAISRVNNNKGTYIFNIVDSFDVAGVTANNITAAAGEELHITIKGVDAERTIGLSSNGRLLSFGARVTVVLEENITLQGRTNDNYLVFVGGTMIMNNGAKITGNTNSRSNPTGYATAESIVASGVYVSGNFIMNGGEISNNSAIISSQGTNTISTYGGGVYVAGTFNMNGGKISGNSVRSTKTYAQMAYAYGGGVYITGTFIMKGGEIVSNSASATNSASAGNREAAGGGVYNAGGFFILKGTISGNSALLGSQLYNAGTATLYDSNGDGTSLTTTNIEINADNGVPPQLPPDPLDAIPLTADVWTDGNISINQTIWYSFPVTQGTTYYIWWDDNIVYGINTTKTGAVYVGAKYANGDIIFGGSGTFWGNGVMGGFTTPRTITANADGTVLVRLTDIRSGTFGIVYNTTGVRPE